MNRRFILSSIAIAMLLLSASLSVLTGTPVPEEQPNKAMISGYTTHAPITISSDADFAAQALTEGWPGNGSQSNPYRIENYDIDGSNSTNAVNIYLTTVYFILRNCSIHDAQITGIYLSNLANAVVQNNTLADNNGYGIQLQSCSACIIIENNCTNTLTYAGIFLTSTTGCIIENNSCTNSFTGIYIYFNSNNNRLANNTCSDQNYGILLYLSSGCLLRNNIFVNDGLVLWGNTLGSWNNYDIDTSNRANSKPIYYYKNQASFTVPSGAGQVILANCSYVRVENQSIGNTSFGVEVGYSSNITVSNCTISDSTYNAVTLVSSTYCVVDNNTCRRNANFGIYLYLTSDSTVSNNSCVGPSFYGIYLLSANDNRIENNTCTADQVGVFIDYCINDTLKDNQLDRGIAMTGSSISEWNSHYIDASNYVKSRPIRYVKNAISFTVPSGAGQVVLANCMLVTVDSQNLSDAAVGFMAGYSNDCTIRYSNCSGSTNYGMYVDSCVNLSVYNNSILNNVLFGLYLYQSQKCCVWNNTFTGNNGATSVYNSSRVQAGDTASSPNRWNTSSGYGNLWTDWTSPDNIPPSGDGIVDMPYTILGSAGAMDYFPKALSSSKIPICTITSPTGNSIFYTRWGWIKLSGTATDDASVMSVTWINSLGGSGTAYMTPQFGGPSLSWQSRGQVQLYPGTNVITVTVTDVEGYTGTDVLTVEFDTTLPICTITSPTTSATYSINSTTVDLAGSATDANGIATIMWKNVATGEIGTAAGPTNWTMTGINLNIGLNLIYVNVTDNAGNKGTDAIWVTSDLNNLTVTITDPTGNSTMTTNWHYIKLKGTASDDNKVALVTWSNNRTGDSGITYMVPQWGAASVSWQSRGQVHLLPGSNVITVTAYDSAGNTATDVLTVSYSGP